MVKWRPSSMIRPSLGCHRRPGLERPRSVSSASMVGFQRLSQFRRGPTVKAISRRTGPVGNSATPARLSRTCSLYLTESTDAVVRTEHRMFGGRVFRAGATLIHESAAWLFAAQTETNVSLLRRLAKGKA